VAESSLVDVVVTRRLDCELGDKAIEKLLCHCWTLHQGPPRRRVEIVFLGEKEHTALHEEFFQDSTPTDVMAFPFVEEEVFGREECPLFGEILVNVEMAATEAKLRKSDVAQELALYVVHGALHLLGFDDLNEADCKKMRRAEQDALLALDFMK